MTKFQRVLKKLHEASQQIVVGVNGKEAVVTVAKIDEDHVILHDIDGDARFDLHFSQVIIVGTHK